MVTTQKIVRDPIYQQLNAALRDLLGRYAVGDKFLSERQVCERFDVSRATANKAISNLVVEGLLRHRKGIGTFACGRPLDYDLRALVSFTHKARAAGKRPSTRVLTLEQVAAEDVEDEVRTALELPDRTGELAGRRTAEAAGRPAAARDGRPGNAGNTSPAGSILWRIERLRLADGEPVILERRWIPAELCPRLTQRQLEGSLYALWTDKLGLAVAGSDAAVRAVNLDDDDAALLATAPTAAALRVCAVGRLDDGRPLWYEQTLYRGDAYIFRNRTGGLHGGGAAVGELLEAIGD